MYCINRLAEWRNKANFELGSQTRMVIRHSLRELPRCDGCEIPSFFACF